MKDYLNQKLGKLLVVEYLGKEGKDYLWKCICDCGNECVKTTGYIQRSKNPMCKSCYSKFLSENTHKYRTERVTKECPVEYCSDYAVINGVTKVDIEDVDRLLVYKRNIFKNSSGYACLYFNDTQLFVHRIIMNLPDRYDEETKLIVDHINGDKTDNRKSNLRVIEKQLNPMNCKTYKNNSSGRKGVHWNKKLQKWTASIQSNKINLHLGVFEDYNDAVEAREQAEKDLFGEFNRAE